MKTPTMIYKPNTKGALNLRGVGTFDCKTVDADQVPEELENGWLEAPEVPSEPQDDAPPTRAELEEKAKELGIKFPHNTSDAKLAEKIANELD